ncbi:MAG: hypothetical protein ACLP0L_03305 [Solirubrobacteraceae bacterium]
MVPVTYQTIRLSKGKHTSKEHGACVMELSSMLGDEPFSDHPASVCPVIASLLRAYNDSIDDQRRQDLYGYAARVVGSRGSTELERMRTEYVTAWMARPKARRWTRYLVPAWLHAMSPKPPLDVLGAGAVRSLCTHDDRTHAKMLALIDTLLEMGPPAPPAATPESAAAPTATRPERARVS